MFLLVEGCSDPSIRVGEEEIHFYHLKDDKNSEFWALADTELDYNAMV